jgi:hypothetical protein
MIRVSQGFTLGLHVEPLWGSFPFGLIEYIPGILPGFKCNTP